MPALVIKPGAILMAKEAYDWYEERKKGLGDEFLEQLDAVYDKISLHPEYFGKVKLNFRQAALKKFPFVVVFEKIKEEVVVFAVFHTKRNPKLKFKK